jgi:hypothetical protein
VYVRSSCAYEGADSLELSFPNDVLIRLLRKNIITKRSDDNEEWWEGKFENDYLKLIWNFF